MATATWIANVGIPLIGTVAAIVLGLYALGAQQRHDRRIQYEQRRSLAAAAVGHEIRRFLDQIEESSPEDLLEIDSGWRFTARPTKALADAVAVLGDEPALGLVDTILRDMSTRLGLCQQRYQTVQPPAEPAGWATYNVLAENAVPLGNLAVRFIRWDGTGSLPSIQDDEYGKWVPSPRGVEPSVVQGWKQSVIEDFDLELEGLIPIFSEEEQAE